MTDYIPLMFAPAFIVWSIVVAIHRFETGAINSENWRSELLYWLLAIGLFVVIVLKPLRPDIWIELFLLICIPLSAVWLIIIAFEWMYRHQPQVK